MLPKKFRKNVTYNGVDRWIISAPMVSDIAHVTYHTNMRSITLIRIGPEMVLSPVGEAGDAVFIGGISTVAAPGVGKVPHSSSSTIVGREEGMGYY